MSVAIKMERSLLQHDEFEMLSRTHHPAMLDVEDEALSDMRARLRGLREKEKGFVHDMRRGIRGKADTRGGSFPGNIEKPARRKQLFANALKRVNGEIARRRSLAAREEMQDAARRALELKNSAKRHHPQGGRTSRKGMAVKVSGRGRTSVPGAKIGSVSQATKNVQAAKDSRG